MPITITWNDGVTTPTVFTMPDEVLTSVDQYRQVTTSFDPSSGASMITYPTVQAMIVGVFVQQIILPALARFPTPAVAAAQAACVAAEAGLAQAQAAAVPGLTP